MTVQAAEALLFKSMNMFDRKVEQVFETNNYFVFDVVPIDTNGAVRRPIAPPFGVNKKTGRVAPFNPASVPTEELTSSKRIR